MRTLVCYILCFVISAIIWASMIIPIELVMHRTMDKETATNLFYVLFLVSCFVIAPLLFAIIMKIHSKGDEP